MRLILALICAASLWHSVSVEQGWADTATSLEKVSLQLKWYHQFQFAGYYAAKVKGFYRQEGLDVTLLEGGPPRPSPLKSVLSGKAQYGVLDGELLDARLHGAPVVLLAVIFQHSPNALMSRKDRGITQPSDFIGRTIMYTKGHSEVEFKALFNSEGVPIDKINFVPHTGSIDPIIDGRVDADTAYLTNEPYMMLQRGVEPSLIRPINYGIDFYGDSLFTTEDEILHHPERVAAFRRASIKGWEYAMNHIDEMIDVLMTFPSVKEHHFTAEQFRFEAEKMKQLIQPDLVEIGHVNPLRWKGMAETLVHLDIVKPGYSLDGFIYDPNPKPDYAWVRWTLGTSAAILLLVGIGAIVLFIFNRRLTSEVTGRKRVEEALRESEDKFRSIFEEAMDGIMIADAETRRQLDANKAMCSMLGYSHDELVGLGMNDIHPGYALPAIREFFERQRRGEISFVPEIPLVRKNGSVFYADVNATSVTLGGKHCLVGIFRDTTERKQEKEKLLESRNLLRESQMIAGLGSYMLDIPTGLWSSTDVLDNIFGINQEYERSLEGWVALIHPDDRTTMSDYFNEVIGKGKPFDNEYRIIRYNDQAERWVHGIGKLDFDADGQPLKMHGTIQDITDRKKLEEQLFKSQKLESIGTLAGGIAHDFNNLLQGIFGYISMAKNSIEQKEEALAMLTEAEKALHLSVNLTTQLLTFSKGGKPVKKLIRLSPVVESAVMFALSGSHTDYEWVAPADLRPVEADEGQLAQVVQNIVLNANEAMTGHGTVYVSLANVDSPENEISRPAGGGPFVRIDIRDTGIGIPAQNLTRIFDPYFSTKQKGSGLGLATSYSIIKNHGGTIEVTSNINKGSTFSIYLPAATEAIHTEETSHEKSAGIEKCRILLMDDEEVVRNVGTRMIKVLGHEVDAAADGAKAVELFGHARESDTPYDLVILDLTVKGGVGGEEAIKKIREIDPQVAVVVSSGYADNAVVADYRAYGFSASLNKPYELEALRNCIETVLGNDRTGV